MYLPVVRFPCIVIDNLPYFTPILQTEEQVKHFYEHVTGLMVGDRKTITTINALFLNNNDQSALNKFPTLTEGPNGGPTIAKLASP